MTFCSFICTALLPRGLLDGAFCHCMALTGSTSMIRQGQPERWECRAHWHWRKVKRQPWTWTGTGTGIWSFLVSTFFQVVLALWLYHIRFSLLSMS